MAAAPAMTDQTPKYMTWAEWCKQAHERPLPREVVEEVEKLERDGVEDENEDDEDDDGTATTDDA